MKTYTILTALILATGAFATNDPGVKTEKVPIEVGPGGTQDLGYPWSGKIENTGGVKDPIVRGFCWLKRDKYGEITSSGIVLELVPGNKVKAGGLSKGDVTIKSSIRRGKQVTAEIEGDVDVHIKGNGSTVTTDIPSNRSQTIDGSGNDLTANGDGQANPNQPSWGEPNIEVKDPLNSRGNTITVNGNGNRIWKGNNTNKVISNGRGNVVR